MGQKTHPKGLRLGINETWDSQWYAGKNYSKYLAEDIRIREELMEKLRNLGDNHQDAGVAKIVITRPSKDKIHFTIHVSRPGVIIGRKGEEIKRLRADLRNKLNKEIFIDVKEVKIPELEAKLVAENVASSLTRRVSFRRAMKKSIQNTMKYGAEGIKIACSGRLGGAEMSRSEWYSEGRVPLHTLKSRIDYSIALAKTTYGVIGVKVWVCKKPEAE